MTAQNTSFHLSDREIFRFDSAALDEETQLHVVRFRGEEGLSRLFRFELTLATDAPTLPVEDMLSARARLTVARNGGADAVFSGFPTNIVQISRYGGWSFYSLVLQPGFWYYGRVTGNAIFVGRNAREVLEACMESLGAYNVDWKFRLYEDHPSREFSMQHNENLLDYMSWWMEREGIYYFFEEADGGERVVFTDSLSAHTPLDSTPTLRYAPVSGLEAAHTEEIVTSFSLDASPLPRSVYVRDYNWLDPDVPVEGTATVSERGLGELYFYGDGFTTSEEGNRLASLRAESLICHARRFSGTSAVPTLRPGFNFNLDNHYDPACNRGFTVVSVTHEGGQEAFLSTALGVPIGNPDVLHYRNSFTCIPDDMQFRAEFVTTRKKVAGMISAFVDASSDGPSPEISSTGRYKVVFPQDMSGRGRGRASCWLRRMHPQVGLGYGTTLPLQPGVEVLVAFVDGDPDRPFIAGAVGNAESGYPDSDESAQNTALRTAGGNSLLFNDGEAKQGLLLNTGGNSGIMMSSGSLDTYFQYSDSTSSLSTSIGDSFAGLANKVSGGIESSLSASYFSLDRRKKILTVLKFLRDASASFSKGLKYDEKKTEEKDAGEKDRTETRLNWAGTALSSAAELIKLILELEDAQHERSKIPQPGANKKEFAASLVADEDEVKLKLQTGYGSEPMKKYISFAMLSFVMNAASTVNSSYIAMKRAQSDLEKARTDKSEYMQKGGVDQSKLDKYDEDIRKAGKSLEAAKHTVARNVVKTSSGSLLSELISLFLIHKARNKADPKGVYIGSPTSSITTHSTKETVVSSSETVSLLAFPDIDKAVEELCPDRLSSRMKSEQGSVNLISQTNHLFGVQENRLLSARKTHIQSPSIVISSGFSKDDPLDRNTDPLQSVLAASPGASTTCGILSTLQGRRQLAQQADARLEMNTSTNQSRVRLANRTGSMIIENTPANFTSNLVVRNNEANDSPLSTLTFDSFGATLASHDDKVQVALTRENDQERITLSVNKGSSLTLEKNATLDAGKGDVKAKGKKLSLEFNELSAKGSAGISLDAGSGQISLSSASLQQNATGSVKLNGSVLMLG